MDGWEQLRASREEEARYIADTAAAWMREAAAARPELAEELTDLAARLDTGISHSGRRSAAAPARRA